MRLTPVLLVVACLVSQAGEPIFTDVFVAGKEGYHTYRIPAITIAKDGTLLAFAEGRIHPRDHAENDLVLKRSKDGGATWLPLQVVDQDGENALNNPCAVVLRDSGRILLVYQHYFNGFGEHKAKPGYEGNNVCRTRLVHSDDHGATWSAPRDITPGVKRPEIVTSTASGPGIGLQLERGPHAGRILIPFNQGPYGKWKVYAAMSDDNGATWRFGETAPETPKGFANEVQFVERADGSVLLNARNQNGAKVRKQAVSTDGGATWSPLAEIDLIDPTCAASVLRVTTPSGPLFVFSGPGSNSKRIDGTLWTSTDEGATWPASKPLMQGPFAYSCLVQKDAATLGCLFETGAKGPYEKITFATIPIEWLARPAK